MTIRISKLFECELLVLSVERGEGWLTVILKPLLGASRYGSLLKKVLACFDLSHCPLIRTWQ
jgi:hypothetical protein